MTALGLRPGNPMGRAMMSVLVVEAVMALILAPALTALQEVPGRTAWTAAAVVVVLAIAACALLRRPLGYLLGWVTQLVMVLTGLLTPVMWAVGGFFAVIWVTSWVFGRRLEARVEP